MSGTAVFADLKATEESLFQTAVRRIVLALTTVGVGAVAGMILANALILAIASNSVEEGWSTAMTSTVTGLARMENDLALHRMEVCTFLGLAVRFLAMVLSGVFLFVMNFNNLSVGGFVLLLLQFVFQRHYQQDMSQYQSSNKVQEDILGPGEYTHFWSGVAIMLCAVIYMAACKQERLSLPKAVIALALGGAAGLELRLGFMDEFLCQNFEQESSKAFAASFYRYFVEPMSNNKFDFLPLMMVMAGTTAVIVARFTSVLAFKSGWSAASAACVAGSVVTLLKLERQVNAVQDSNLKAMEGIRRSHTASAICFALGAVFAVIELARSGTHGKGKTA